MERLVNEEQPANACAPIEPICISEKLMKESFAQVREGEIAYGIQTVVLEAHRRQTRRALAQALGYVGNVIVDDEVRDVARGDGVALGVVLIDGFRQIAPLVASINIPAGHELAERVQDPLLRRLIAGGALGRVVPASAASPAALEPVSPPSGDAVSAPSQASLSAGEAE